MKSSRAIFVALITCTSHVAAFWRMQCQYETGLDRIDPIVDPGQISSHVHTFMGGSGISFFFLATYDTLQARGRCTSCAVSDDHSAYWTPALYFIYSNGTAVVVPQVGGMLAYYLPYLDNIAAFPEGFRMLAGNPYIRNFTGPFPDTLLSFWPTNATDDQFFLQQRALGFDCLNYAVAPEPSLYRHVMPSMAYMDANCLDGLRLELAFPSCSNGELDSPDHQSHMAYPSLVKEGNCPEGEDGTFVLSNGDPVGTGYHGDFMMGWKSRSYLQDALDTCTNLSGEIQDCPLFNIQSDADAANCKLDLPQVLVDDQCQGPRSGLPVDMPIQYGPGQATTYPIAGRSGQPTTSLPATARPSSFSNEPTLTYSPADRASTKSALGGIVVAMETSTPGPDVVSAEIATTIVITKGKEALELLVAEVVLTKTTTVVATLDANNKRHVHRHAQHHYHP